MRLALVLLAACATAAQPIGVAEPGAPAVIVEPTPQSRAALLQAVTDAVGVQPLLADDALTTGSTLLLERRHLLGRDTSTPERFRLVKSGDRCLLVHDRTGRSVALVETRCRSL